jgi:hypothetical protein
MSTFRSEQLRQPLSLSGSFTGSLQGTSSFATTASYATFAANGGGSVDTGSLLTTASFNSYTSSTTSQFAGTASFATTASFALNAGGAGFPFNGNAVITGSLVVSGSSGGRSGITGSLFGTASWANNAISANTANTANFATTAGNGGVTSVSIFDGYPLSVNGNTTGNVQIKTSYLQFSQIFNQDSGGGAITILSTPINNISELTWSTQGTGVFALTADNGATPFTANKTMIQLNLGSVSNVPIYATHEYVSTSQIRIHIFDRNGEPVEDALIYANIDIKIFP